ncbi:MAG: cytidylate kinase family protein [Phycisphaerae bacterium]|nr:cytidylate kinase family protein [Phycisphaerae bacterium]
MSPEKTPISRELSQLVEKQLRNWEIAQAQKSAVPVSEERPVADFIAISRAVGLPARKVATLLHDRLGWVLFDKQILQAMAGNDDYRRRLYNNLDGRDIGWLEGFMRGLTLGRLDKDDYFRRLTSTVLSIARQGHAIFVGRATHLFLPRDIGLRVRLTAPRAFCLESYARLKGLPVEKVAREVEQIEEERERFVRNHFHVGLADETVQDLVVNMERFSVEATVDLIMSALRARGVIAKRPPAPGG